MEEMLYERLEKQNAREGGRGKGREGGREKGREGGREGGRKYLSDVHSDVEEVQNPIHDSRSEHQTGVDSPADDPT
jgi:hypothetical protein